MTYLTSTYHDGFVILSIVVAMMASYTALNLTGRVTESRGRTGLIWLGGGAISMGSGIWAMHFIGMLAFSLPIRVSYEISITMLSLLTAIAVSAFALRIVARPTVCTRHYLIGGLLMGLGICVMHYMGMHAMRMNPAIYYDTSKVIASVMIAVVTSIAALWLAFTLRAGHTLAAHAKKAGAAVIMGLAIIAMHYTGMEAAHFDVASICMVEGGVDGNWLALLVGLASLSMLIITVLLSFLDSFRHKTLHDGLTHLPNADCWKAVSVKQLPWAEPLL